LILLSTLSQPLLGLGLAAVLSYNGLYTLWWKRHWAFAAVPGAVPGALPILMGYAAAQGSVFTPGGLYLFAILFFWQMPHFWVLALKYKSDYAAGGVPTLPVALGRDLTVRQIAVWCLAYVALAGAAPWFLNTGWVYGVIAGAVSLKLLWELFAFARAPETKKWLHFFLWVNFSLILYVGGAAADLWSVYLTAWIKG
jgi:protoheme IX farnesyltransferase